MAEYECSHCRGIAQITIRAESEKATELVIEFRPFCGMSNSYPEETE